MSGKIDKCYALLLQWRNRGQCAHSAPPPRHFSQGNFCWHMGKIESKDKRGNGGEKKENYEREGGKVKKKKWKGKKYETLPRPPFFFFFFFFCGFFFFFFFFFLLFTFQNHWNLFRVYQNGKFLPGKIIFHAGSKSGKVTLPPMKNIHLTPLYYCQYAGECIGCIATFNIFVSQRQFDWQITGYNSL